MLRHADFVLLPNSRFPKTATDTFIPVIETTRVADWTTIHVSAMPTLTSLVAGSEKRSALVILITFKQEAGNAPNTIVGGRTFCVGATDQRANGILASSLDARLPIIAPFVEVTIWFPANQTNVNGIQLAVWVSNEPSYNTTVPYPVGDVFSSGFAGDSLMGDANAGNLNTARGVLVPPLQFRVVEFCDQMIGKCGGSFTVEAVTGAAPAAAEVGTWIASKAFNDITDNTMDQTQWAFGNTVNGNFSGVPLTGFRQGVGMFNFSAPNRDFVWHWTVYPETT